MPIITSRGVIGEIDIAGSELDAFGAKDQRLLEQIAEVLARSAARSG